MSISTTLTHFLERGGIDYDAVEHAPSRHANRAAEAADVPGDSLAKTVLLRDDQHLFGIVLSATKHVDLTAVRYAIGHQCGLAIESDVARVFPDCEPGAIPATPQAFGLNTLIDYSLLTQDFIYSHSGDCSVLFRIKLRDFAALLPNDAVIGTFKQSWHRH